MKYLILLTLILSACSSPAPHQERRKRVTDALRDVKNIEKGQVLNSLFQFENRIQQEEHLFEVLGWGSDSTGQALVLYKDTVSKLTDVQEINRKGAFLGGTIEDVDADSLLELHLRFEGKTKHNVICEIAAEQKGLKTCNVEEIE